MTNVFVPDKAFPGESPLRLATVDSTDSTGATLRFAGETVATIKRYKTLKNVSISAGDRVLCAAISGTYVIIGVVPV